MPGSHEFLIQDDPTRQAFREIWGIVDAIDRAVVAVSEFNVFSLIVNARYNRSAGTWHKVDPDRPAWAAEANADVTGDFIRILRAPAGPSVITWVEQGRFRGETPTRAFVLQEPLLFSADATHDIGSSGALRPRDVYLSRDLFVGRNARVTNNLTIDTMTLGSVLFAGTGGLVSQDNSTFFWDATNNRLGLGLTNPATRLEVTGESGIRTSGGSHLSGTLTPIYQRDSGGLIVDAFDEFGTMGARAPSTAPANWVIFGGSVQGDTFGRIVFILNSGLPVFGVGPGNATRDTFLERQGTGSAATAAGWIMYTTNAGRRPLVLRGAAAQTAALLVFMNSASSVLSFIDASGFLGINMTVALDAEAVVRSTSTGATRGIISYQFTNDAIGARFFGQKSRVSGGNPAAVASSDVLLEIIARGHDGTNFQHGSYWAIVATEAWSGTARGSRHDWYTIDNTTTTQDLSLRLDQNGKLSSGAVNRLIHLQSMARVTKTATTAIATATATVVPFDSETFDTDTLHDNVTNNSRLTAQVAGKYLVTANVQWEASAVGERTVVIRKQGATAYASVLDSAALAGETHQSVSALVNLAAAEYVEALVTQNSGGNLNVQIPSSFSMVLVGE